MLQRHYPVPVVVLRKICKIPLYSCTRLLIRRKTLTSEEEFEVFERDRSQKEPNMGNRVDVSKIHSADPLIFLLPKHFCGRTTLISKSVQYCDCGDHFYQRFPLLTTNLLIVFNSTVSYHINNINLLIILKFITCPDSSSE